MRYPNFLVVGAQKAGTSWLSSMLQQHPDIYMPPRELHFFDKRHHWERGAGWYAGHFEPARTESAIGEKTPDYLWVNRAGAEGHMPGAHHRIHDTLPGVRLLAILRDPVERAISAVNHLVRSGRVSPLWSIDSLLVGRRRHLTRPHGVLDKGRYHGQLDAYLELFDRERVLVLIYEEDVVGRPRKTLRRVCRFLEVDPAVEFGDISRRVNVSRSSRLRLAMDYHLPALRRWSRRLDRRRPPWKGRPSPAVVRELRRRYAPENERLFEILGRRVSAWNGS